MNLVGLLGPAAILLSLTTLVSSQAVPADGSMSVEPRQSLRSVEAKASPRAPASDPLLDLAPLRETRTSLIGGVVESVDPVRDRLVLRPFGGRKLEIVFDPRTQFLRGGETAGVQSLHRGDRVHVETVLQGSRVFARIIHLPSDTGLGEAWGQILKYDAAAGQFTMRDELSSRPIQFSLQNSSTGKSDLSPGTLVRVRFLPGAGRAVAREIVVLAAPGSAFTFVGRVTYLNLASRQLVVVSSTDNKKYEIQLNPALVESGDHLREGVDVTIAARFDGEHYVAENVTVSPSPIQ